MVEWNMVGASFERSGGESGGDGSGTRGQPRGVYMSSSHCYPIARKRQVGWPNVLRFTQRLSRGWVAVTPPTKASH